jgi:hypothetical protein
VAWGRRPSFHGSFEELVLRKHGQQIARFTIVKQSFCLNGIPASPKRRLAKITPVFFLACLLDVPSEHQCNEDYGYIQEQLDGKVLKQLIDWQVMTP